MSDFSILDVISGSSDVPPLRLAPKGDYKLRIRGAWYKRKEREEDGKITKSILVCLEFIEFPDYPEILDTLYLPIQGDSDKNINSNLRRIEEFKKCFSTPRELAPELGSAYQDDSVEKEELESLQGLEGWVSVSNETNKLSKTQENRVKGSPFNTGGYLQPR